MKRLRVLFAPRNIAGQPTEWAAALKELGHHAEVWSFGEAAFGIPVDRVFDQDRLLADPLYRWQVLDDAVRGFDVFHFQYGRSLLNAHEPELPELWDLPLLRSLGKRVFMHWHGSDVRLKSKHMEREGPDSYLADATVDEDAILARVSICRRFCDRMFVSTPGLLDYVPDARHIPLAIDAAAWATERGPEPDKPVVVHIPSKRATKGSHHVDAALIPLHEQGVIEYRALSGLTREQVKAEFRRADMVVDSMTIGDHGLVAVEAMACGAVALAHVHERNRARTPGTPVVEVTKDTLGKVVRELAADPRERARLRAEGVAWVRRHHDREAVARLLVQEYTAPRTKITTGYPDWPRTAGDARLRALEAEVERLRREGGAPARPTLRDRIEANPALHLAARRLAARVRRK
ncbi:glycosyltransferase family protein [Carbonactinospora thermoautotrophica]|uniref:Glycosyltransferase n=1 Tax=Carbonactinospora thermoautotrophica TaxID=1469144 RepID=A0A132MWZ8_9ACTN|nr:glycosyltransferase [Carbonactinospora thermoautotrophica]KWX02391.1 hypothetical protein LI90_3434 [Carbonactinospora thermoautotrophica]